MNPYEGCSCIRQSIRSANLTVREYGFNGPLMGPSQTAELREVFYLDVVETLFSFHQGGLSSN